MSAPQHDHHQKGAHPKSSPPAHSSYWKFAHRDWRFWLGLILIFAAMLAYLLSEDLSVRPVSASPQLQMDPVGGK